LNQFIKIKTILLVSIFLINGVVAQDSDSNKRFANWFWNDPSVLARDFNMNNWVAIGYTGIALGGLTNFDQSNSSFVQNRYYGSEFLNITNEFGTFKIVAPATAAIFVGTLLTKNSKLQDAAFTSFQAVINTAITVNISKFVFARSRPHQDDGPHDFDFFQPGETSFPSGHASTAFALFVPWVSYYPNALTYSLLIIPVGTSIARIAHGKHWLSDVTAGALIGTYWARYLSKKHMRINEMSDRINFTPIVMSNGGGISISFKL
tara:strand:+ start:4250 stop:5038 length:789 start_codon:yes stop_codon:yes gene_type:complete